MFEYIAYRYKFCELNRACLTSDAKKMTDDPVQAVAGNLKIKLFFSLCKVTVDWLLMIVNRILTKSFTLWSKKNIMP